MRTMTSEEIESCLEQIMDLEESIRELKELSKTGKECLNVFWDRKSRDTLIKEAEEKYKKDFGGLSLYVDSYRRDKIMLRSEQWYYDHRREDYEDKIRSLQKPIDMSAVKPPVRHIKKPEINEVTLTEEEREILDEKFNNKTGGIAIISLFLSFFISYKKGWGVLINVLLCFFIMFLCCLLLDMYISSYKKSLKKARYDEWIKKYNEDVEILEREKREEEIRSQDPEVIKRREDILRKKNEERLAKLNIVLREYHELHFCTSDDNFRVLQEMVNWSSDLLQASIDAQNSLYSLANMDTKYRNYGVLSKMREEFRKGYVVRLEGDGGAYNRMDALNATRREAPVCRDFNDLYKFMIRITFNPTSWPKDMYDMKLKEYRDRIIKQNERAKNFLTS